MQSDRCALAATQAFHIVRDPQSAFLSSAAGESTFFCISTRYRAELPTKYARTLRQGISGETPALVFQFTLTAAVKVPRRGNFSGG